jgi:glycosyltransferase involved in cell wall biosynthesis
MSQATAPEHDLCVERLDGLDGWGMWAVSRGARSARQAPQFPQWQAAAERCMRDRAEVAAATISPELTFFSGRTADLIGVSVADGQSKCPSAQLDQWLNRAALKGLVHQSLDQTGSRTSKDRLSGAETVVDAPPFASAVSVGIEAEWLIGTESGAQVAAVELVRELATRPEIARIVLLSNSGVVPGRLAGPKVSGLSWTAALASGRPAVDILHRPYQPGADVDFRRYLQVGTCVAITVLDQIAYDNPAYHESAWWQRRYQQAFDEQVCLADCVFAISGYVGTRLERQYEGRLAGPVRSIPLGTDHLQAQPAVDVATVGAAVAALQGQRYLLVLGNDFEHKNRDFAVKVFAEMCDRGYDGQLVMAGFHLDGGSTYGHELSGAGRHTARVVRLGSVPNADKVWLLQNAQAVLYPTSAEGFGLVPFEAASLGTPTAFVRFGPLLETLPNVDACDGWQVRPFADHVFRLLEHPDRQLDQIRAAGKQLTWRTHVDQVLAGYRFMLGPHAPWRTRGRALPGWPVRWQRTAGMLSYRVANKLRRLAGRTP